MPRKSLNRKSMEKPVSIVFFSTQKWTQNIFEKYDSNRFSFRFLETRLSEKTASLVKGHDTVCVFVNDNVSAEVIGTLKEYGVRLIALRCAGFNNVDLQAAEKAGIGVVRVPAYSPHAVAEYALGLILALNRKYHRAYNRVREGNFSLDGLMGFDVHNKTVGVIGTGRIGWIFCRVMRGLGCRVIAYDRYPKDNIEADGVEYVSLEILYRQSDIISLHCPLSHETYHIINDYAIRSMKPGVMIINTSRGPLIDSTAVINGLKEGKIGAVGLDVYEEEGDLFFEDLSDKVIQDDVFVRLQMFPNVIITGHQAFFTLEALENIATTTLDNIRTFFIEGACENSIEYSKILGDKAGT